MPLRSPRPAVVLALAIAAVMSASCTRGAPRAAGDGAVHEDTAAALAAAAGRTSDSAFRATQARGAGVMGVDQRTSAHVFESLADGGRIVLERPDTADSAGIRTIRAHMRAIASQFAAGDFTAPGLVHARDVPGTAVMAARHAAIAYAAVDRPRGAEVRISTADPAAVAAVHEFLAYQRGDHRAPGHEGMDGMDHARHGAP